jgi:hypothetical protein
MKVMLASGLDIRPVIKHRFPYQDFEQAFQAMRTGNTGKVILRVVLTELSTRSANRIPDVPAVLVDVAFAMSDPNRRQARAETPALIELRVNNKLTMC